MLLILLNIDLARKTYTIIEGDRPKKPTSSFLPKKEDSMLESTFKLRLRKKIENLFPEAVIIHLDPNDIPGIPDMLILNDHRWAALEGKAYENASHQPNQDYYVSLLNDMSYSSFVYPENEEEVLYELQQAFSNRRSSRVSRRK